MDIALSMIINKMEVTLPIMHIKDSLYLIGPQRMTCALKREFVMIRIGGGYERFEEHISRNQRYY